jgi:hypothetical protein
MKHRIFFVLTVTPLSFPCEIALAELTWLDSEIEVRCALGDETVKAEFRFENRGETRVPRLEVHRSCGCTSAKIACETASLEKNARGTPNAQQADEKREFAPGEKGTVLVEVNLGKQTGVIARSVRVKTDKDAPGQLLTLKAVVPNPVEVAPKQLEWVIGREIKPKTILVTATEGMKNRPVALKCLHPVLEAQYKVVEKDKSVELSVRPGEIDGSLLSEVQFSIDVSSGKTTARKQIGVPIKVDYDW